MRGHAWDVGAMCIFAWAIPSCGVPATPASPEPKAPASRSSPSSADVEEDRCLASFARNRPVGWTETGRLVIALDEGRPTSMTAEDAHGNVVETKPAPKSKAEAQETMRSLTCRLGGLVVVVGASELAAKDSSAPKTATFAVLTPTVADARADITALCREPSNMPADADERQRYRIAFDTLDERLTTQRWRGWLWNVLAENDRTEGAARESLRSAKADELRTAADRAGVEGPCWYETALRKRAPR